jgi:hypothetical protein
MPDPSHSSEYQCCFCGQTIAEREPDPVMLNFAVEGGGGQELPSHAACLRRLVHPSVPLAVSINVSREMAVRLLSDTNFEVQQ